MPEAKSRVINKKIIALTIFTDKSTKRATIFDKVFMHRHNVAQCIFCDFNIQIIDDY